MKRARSKSSRLFELDNDAAEHAASRRERPRWKGRGQEDDGLDLATE